MGARSAYAIQALTPAALPTQAAEPGSPADLSRAVRYAAVWEDHAYVAANDGCLHHYTLHAREASSVRALLTQPAAWHLEKSLTISATGKPIERVFVYASLYVIAVLCGTLRADTENTLRFFSYPHLGPASNGLAPIKGVQAIADDADAEADEAAAGFVSLCLLKRKKLVLIMIEPRGWGTVKEIALGCDAFVARRFDDVVCVASPSEYSLVHLDSGVQTPLGLPISQSTEVSSARIRPSIVPVAFGSLHTFLITSHSDAGTLGAFLRSDGEPTDKLIEWPSHPRSVVADPPYIIALLRNDTIEVHDLRTMRCVQTLAVSADMDPRFLLRILGDGQLLSQPVSEPLETCVVEIGAKELPSPPDEESHETQALLCPLPIPPAARATQWRPVRTLIGYKRAISCLTLPTPSSMAWKYAQAHNWGAADEALDVPGWAAPEMRTAAYLALNHIRATRFIKATPWLLRTRFDARLLLDKYPRFRGLLVPAKVEMDALLGEAWNAIPPVDRLIDANLLLNYGQELSSDPGMQELRQLLHKRADNMLEEVLRDTVQRDNAPVYQAALLTLALERDAHAPSVDLLPHAAECPVEMLEPTLATYHRFGLKAELLRRRGQVTDALQIHCGMVDGTLHDPVDCVTADQVARDIEQLATSADIIHYGLWLAQHDLQQGLKALLRVDYHGSDSERVLASLRELDADAAEQLLEHVVFTSAEQTQAQHAELCARLVKTSVASADTVPPYTDRRRSLPAHLAEHVSMVGARARIKLMVLLQHSQVLDLASTLQLVAQHRELSFEQAILLARLGRASDALSLLALTIRDPLTSEAFCTQDACVLSAADTHALAQDASIASYATLVQKKSARKPRTASAPLLRTLLDMYLREDPVYVSV